MGFNLKVITPNGMFYDGEVEMLNVKIAEGYVGILKDHVPLVSTVQISRMEIKTTEGRRVVAISSGVIHVAKNGTKIITNAAEYKEDIDIKRAEQSKLRAEERLRKNDENIDIKRAEISLHRAVNRINIGTEQN